MGPEVRRSGSGAARRGIRDGRTMVGGRDRAADAAYRRGGRAGAAVDDVRAAGTAGLSRGPGACARGQRDPRRTDRLAAADRTGRRRLPFAAAGAAGPGHPGSRLRLGRRDPAHGLPRAYSAHNSYYDWGHPPDTATVVLAVGWPGTGPTSGSPVAHCARVSTTDWACVRVRASPGRRSGCGCARSIEAIPTRFAITTGTDGDDSVMVNIGTRHAAPGHVSGILAKAGGQPGRVCRRLRSSLASGPPTSGRRRAAIGRRTSISVTGQCRPGWPRSWVGRGRSRRAVGTSWAMPRRCG